jgi:hypothetical protein
VLVAGFNAVFCGRGVDGIWLLVEVARINGWESMLPVGVTGGFEPATPEIKISRMAAKKLTISKVTIIVLFFLKKSIYIFNLLIVKILLDDAFHNLRTFLMNKNDKQNLIYHTINQLLSN